MQLGVANQNTCRGARLNLLVFVVPDADRLVHGASGNEWLSDAHVHPRHLPMVEGVSEIVKHCRTCTLEGEEGEDGEEERGEEGEDGGEKRKERMERKKRKREGRGRRKKEGEEEGEKEERGERRRDRRKVKRKVISQLTACNRTPSLPPCLPCPVGQLQRG